MGESDYFSFFKDNQYPHPDFIEDKAMRVKIAGELIRICRARE